MRHRTAAAMAGLLLASAAFAYVGPARVTAPARAAAAQAPSLWVRAVPVPAGGLDVAPDGTVVVAGSTVASYPGGSMVLWAVSRGGAEVWRSSWAPDGGYARGRAWRSPIVARSSWGSCRPRSRPRD